MFKNLRYLRAWFVITLLFAVVTVHAALSCSQCGKNIRGRYLKVKGQAYCSKSCLKRKLPKCVLCGKAIGKKAVRSNNGKIYCSEKCFEKTLPKCSECHSVLKKRYFKKNGKLYCNKCYEKIIPNCSMCGTKLRGRYANIGGRFYCMNCAGRPKCFSCQRPANGGKLSDGRYVCKECTKDPVTSLLDLERIRKSVSALLDKHLDLETPPEVEIQLVDYPTLSKKSPHYSEGIELGLFEYKCKIMTRVKRNVFTGKETKEVTKTDERYIIYVLSHLPRHKAKEVMAHEIGHAWMQKHYAGIRDLKVREGWSQYVAHRANTLMDQEFLNHYIETNRDPIYGDGYRQIQELVDKKGEHGLRLEFRRLSRNGRLH